VTSIRIEGVLHEFSSLAEVREDITDLVLNVKQIALRMEGDQQPAAGQEEIAGSLLARQHDHRLRPQPLGRRL
jgi:DNA-directed RNA polymerase subunit alpha